MYCRNCGKEIETSSSYCPRCGWKNANSEPVNGYKVGPSGKSRVVAAILAFFLGGIGVHRFYMGNSVNIIVGIIDILFCWTMIPAIVAFIYGIIFLVETDERFELRVM